MTARLWQQSATGRVIEAPAAAPAAAPLPGRRCACSSLCFMPVILPRLGGPCSCRELPQSQRQPALWLSRVPRGARASSPICPPAVATHTSCAGAVAALMGLLLLGPAQHGRICPQGPQRHLWHCFIGHSSDLNCHKSLNVYQGRPGGRAHSAGAAHARSAAVPPLYVLPMHNKASGTLHCDGMPPAVGFKPAAAAAGPLPANSFNHTFRTLC